MVGLLEPRASLLYLVTLVYLIALASAAALKNITVTVPDGTSDHGDPNLLCSQTKWTDVVIFFLGNYFAHAGTVINYPGESAYSAFAAAFKALLFPLSGVHRGISAIYSHAKFGKPNSDLHTAARAGALCMVARTETWQPRPGDQINHSVCNLPRGASFNDLENERAKLKTYDPPGFRNFLKRSNRLNTFHGLQTLPINSGYELVLVPADADFMDTPSKKIPAISSNYNALKILVALGQSIYAATTLYKARGDQITRYGYAAFGLTVAPYAVMSVINLIGGLVTPQYPAMYLVGSSVMDEARNREGCYFDGEVGRLLEVDPETVPLKSNVENIFWAIDSVLFEQSAPASEIKATFHIRPNSIFPGPSLSSREQNESQGTGLQSRRKKVSLLLGETQCPASTAITETQGQEPVNAGSQSPIPGEIADHDDASPVTPFQSQLSSPSHRAQGPGNSSVQNEVERAVLLIPKCPFIKSSGTKLPEKASEIKITDYLPTTKVRFAMLSFVENVCTSADVELNGVNVTLLAFLSSLISLAIIGGLSKFRKGSSTKAQRGWTLAWWTSGVLLGAILQGVASENVGAEEAAEFAIGVIAGSLVYAAPAIGGFVVVGQMLVSYGTCTTLS